MTRLDQYRNCSTSGLIGLDSQLIAQIQRIAPNVILPVANSQIDFGAGCHPYLQRSAILALNQAIEARKGYRLKINSLYRTLAQQWLLYGHFLNKRCGIVAAAIPGRSNHNTALSLDCDDAQRWRPYLERFGWDWLGSFDPMHFDFQGVGCKDMCSLSIKAFQQLHNFNRSKSAGWLQEDGRWGLQTELALRAAPIEGFTKVPDRGAVEEIRAFMQPWRQSLRLKAEGQEVINLQSALKKKGFFPDLVVDGIFWHRTEEALKAFQSSAGLVADGVAGVATWKALS